jgi:predicted MFS family arabinose efflux permease
MLQLNLLQDQWLFFAIVGGIALILALVLAYLAMWSPREATTPLAEAGPRPTAARKDRHFIPWILIVTFLFIAGFMAIYVARAALQPPNW